MEKKHKKVFDASENPSKQKPEVQAVIDQMRYDQVDRMDTIDNAHVKAQEASLADRTTSRSDTPVYNTVDPKAVQPIAEIRVKPETGSRPNKPAKAAKNVKGK